MDLGSVIGVVGGIILILVAIVSKASLTVFIDPASFFIVMGGTAAAILIAFSLKDVLNTAKVVRKVFFHQEADMDKLVKDFVNYAAIIRKDGAQKLEKLETPDRFVKKSLQLIADGASEEHIQKILTIDKDATLERHRIGQELMETAGDLFPAFGMVGTMIGLVIMLINLSDPSAIGPAMSVALITTFYGAVLANLFAIPMAKKLEQRSNSELTQKDLIIQGTLSLRRAENPRILEDKLQGFLYPGAKANDKKTAKTAPPPKGKPGQKPPVAHRPAAKK